MAICIQSESLIPLREVPAWCHEHLNNRPHLSTVHRWRLRGARGVKLETLLAGGTRYTSHEALARFFAAITAAADGEAFSAVSNGVMNSKAIEQAEAELAAEGALGADDE